jgi:hypothetical protein
MLLFSNLNEIDSKKINEKKDLLSKLQHYDNELKNEIEKMESTTIPDP